MSNVAILSNLSSDPVEFVLTPPAEYGLDLAYKFRARHTLGALTQLIAGAKAEIIIASPFIQESEILGSGPLGLALIGAVRRGVPVDFVSTGSSLAAIRLKKFGGRGGKVRLFQPKRNIKDVRQLGSHAKFCVVDSQHVYVGSATLTSPGLGSNLEMGFVIHGEMANRIASMFRFLNDSGFLIEVT